MKGKKQMSRRDVPRVSILPSLYGERLQGHHAIRVQTVTPKQPRRRDLMLYLHDATSSGSYDWVTGFVIPRLRCVTAGTLLLLQATSREATHAAVLDSHALKFRGIFAWVAFWTFAFYFSFTKLKSDKVGEWDVAFPAWPLGAR